MSARRLAQCLVIRCLVRCTTKALFKKPICVASEEDGAAHAAYGAAEEDRSCRMCCV